MRAVLRAGRTEGGCGGLQVLEPSPQVQASDVRHCRDLGASPGPEGHANRPIRVRSTGGGWMHRRINKERSEEERAPPSSSPWTPAQGQVPEGCEGRRKPTASNLARTPQAERSMNLEKTRNHTVVWIVLIISTLLR